MKSRELFIIIVTCLVLLSFISIVLINSSESDKTVSRKVDSLNKIIKEQKLKISRYESKNKTMSKKLKKKSTKISRLNKNKNINIKYYKDGNRKELNIEEESKKSEKSSKSMVYKDTSYVEIVDTVKYEESKKKENITKVNKKETKEYNKRKMYFDISAGKSYSINKNTFESRFKLRIRRYIFKDLIYVKGLYSNKFVNLKSNHKVGLGVGITF